MRVSHFLVLFLILSFGFTSQGMAQSQQSSTEARKVVRRVVPSYPEIAKRMNLSGTVRVIATVAPDGSVKSVQPMGGSPLLLQSAQDAVNKWKFAAGSAETKEVIELRFDSQ